MTAVQDKLFVIGGSSGSTYHKDFFIIETDPCPEVGILTPLGPRHMYQEYCNKPKFSDVQFLLEGKIFYGHKIILSSMCEKFKTMFEMGFKEEFDQKIIIDNIEYSTFETICHFLYSG